MGKTRQQLESTDVYTLFRETRRPRVFRKTIAYGLGQIYQCDLLTVDRLARYNNGYRYILCVIDIFSRRLAAVPIRRKTSGEIIKAFKVVFKQLGPPKRAIHSDRGREFVNREFKSFLAKRGIYLYHTNSIYKAAICERVQKTIIARLWRYMEYRRSPKWVDILPAVVTSYNASFHRTLQATPNSVNKQNESLFFRKLYPRMPIQRPRFAVGDKVRISLTKSVLTKGYKRTFTDEVFTVSSIRLGYPTVYYVRSSDDEPITGSFYAGELQCVSIQPDHAWVVESVLRRSRGKLLVLFRGHSTPMWISESDLV